MALEIWMYTQDEEICKRSYQARQLSDIPTPELVDFCRDILNKHEDEKVREAWMRDINDDLFMAAGAADVIREREGQEFLLRLMGLRLPATLREKARHFFTGEYPKLETAA